MRATIRPRLLAVALLSAVACLLCGSGAVAQNLDVKGTTTCEGNASFYQSVGIGLFTAPQKPLDIGGSGGIRISQTAGLSSTNELYFQDNGQIRSFDDNHRLLFDRANNVLELREFGDIVFSPGATASNRTQTVTFKSGGNVGIGTWNPTAPLHVKNATAASINFEKTGTLAGTGVVYNDGNMHLESGAASQNVWVAGNNAANVLLALGGGKVAIGPGASLAGELSVSNNTGGSVQTLQTLYSPRSFTAQQDGLQLVGYGGTLGTHDYGAIVMRSDPSTGDGGRAYFDLYAGGSSSTLSANSLFLRAYSTVGSVVSSVQLNTSGTPRIFVDGSGNVGIGTTTPATMLHVSGDIQSGFGNKLTFGGWSQGGTTLWDDNGNPQRTVMVTRATGLSVVNSVNSASAPVTASAYYSSSSITLKSDVNDAPYGLPEVLTLNPKTFRYTDDPTQARQIGFIAEEVDPVLPETVLHDQQGNPSAIDYSKLTVALVGAIKEQQAQLQAQRAQLKAQQDRIGQLESDLGALKAVVTQLAHP